MAGKKKKIFLITILILVFLIIIGVGFLGRIKNVKVVGCEYYTQEEIEKQIMDSQITKILLDYIIPMPQEREKNFRLWIVFP